ncbi:MAG TPA: putative toxin-antitoxin system toxin component, PIN family [Burkholderiales bacterium]
MEKKARPALRVVLDTHVWLDWLVFEDASVAPIRDALAAGRLEAYIDAVCEAELARVLARGFAKRTIDARAQEACIAQVRRLARRIDTPAPQAERAALPSCRDADDQKFLEAALAVRADFLITKDRELLRLAGKRSRVPFRILSPADFGRALGDL